ncbi:MAG: ribosome maturation factor RimP [Clostridium sp.]
MRDDALIQSIDKIVRPIAEEIGYEIYHIEYIKESGEYYLRIYIDQEQGIALSDCEKLSRKVSDMMDIEDPIEDAYFLEVSSPGLNRELFTDNHYKQCIGKEIFVKFAKPLDEKQNVIGILKEVTESSLIICANKEVIVESKTKAKARAKAESLTGVLEEVEKIVTVAKENIKSANLEGEI